MKDPDKPYNICLIISAILLLVMTFIPDKWYSPIVSAIAILAMFILTGIYIFKHQE